MVNPSSPSRRSLCNMLLATSASIVFGLGQAQQIPEGQVKGSA
jgi:hypothetical protein